MKYGLQIYNSYDWEMFNIYIFTLSRTMPQKSNASLVTPLIRIFKKDTEVILVLGAGITQFSKLYRH